MNPTASGAEPKRETFSSFFGQLMTMIGVAVGLGAVWRFPYMVGRFGGSAFVLFYLIIVLFVGIPALMCEWTLGRHTQRGTLGAFEIGGFPGGKIVGFFLFGIVFFATGYYSNALGWVGFFALSEFLNVLNLPFNASVILPPHEGFNIASLLFQLMMTFLVIFACGHVLTKGLRAGIEKISKWIVPLLFIILMILILRSVTLKGAGEGIEWYLGRFSIGELTPSVMAAALGMAFFSLSLGGTFMVIYGSYLHSQANIPKNALLTGAGASLAGILAGLAIFPAVFAFALEPSSGPDLIFSTLPHTFTMMPLGGLFGFLFFIGLFGAAFLSDVAAFEVLVGGITDNTRAERKKSVRIVCATVFVLAIPPMINFKIFIPWDLAFGSGMQALGSLLAVVTAVWSTRKSKALKELSEGMARPFPVFLYWWMRIVVPIAILFVGINWILESVFQVRIFG